MNESSIVQNNSWTDNLSFKFHWWKVPLVKFYGFSCWLSNKLFKFIKTVKYTKSTWIIYACYELILNNNY